MSTLNLSLPENQCPTSPTLKDSPTIPEPMFSLASQANRERPLSFHENDDRVLTRSREDVEQANSTSNKDTQGTPSRSTNPLPPPPYELQTISNQLHELPADLPNSPVSASDSEADSTRDLESGASSQFSIDEKWKGMHIRAKWGRCKAWLSRRSEVQKAVIRMIAVLVATVIAVAIGFSLTSASEQNY